MDTTVSTAQLVSALFTVFILPSLVRWATRQFQPTPPPLPPPRTPRRFLAGRIFPQPGAAHRGSQRR